MSFEIVDKILAAHRGSRFIKADLHVHTPASFDWDEKNPEPEFHSSKVTPAQVVASALSAGLELMAVTDHNSVEWCEAVAEAAQGSGLTVLPAFELTVSPGVHLLAIFEEGKPAAELRDLLIEVGVKRTDFGGNVGTSTHSIDDLSSGYKIVRTLQENGALVIPAHLDLDSGLIGRLKGGHAAESFLDNSGCGILEIANLIPPVVEARVSKDPRRFALLMNSDAHRLDRIGSNSMWLKMDRPSLAGLKQIAYEPLNRIRYTAPEKLSKPQVVGMYTNGSLFRGQTFGFNPDLNCIIGGRGAGKSAIIDYLRFVFGEEPVDADLRDRYLKRIVDLIRHSNTVHVLISDSQGQLFLFERTLEFEETTKGSQRSYRLTSPPAKVCQVLVEERRLVNCGEERPPFRIKFYGQGEVQSITNTAEPRHQMELVDDFIKPSLSQREERAAQLQREIEELEGRINRLRRDLEKLHADNAQLQSVEDRIAEIERDLRESNLESHQVWEDANVWLTSALAHLRRQYSRLRDLKFEELDMKEFTHPKPEVRALLAGIQGGVKRALDLLTSSKAKLESELADIGREIADGKAAWDAEYEAERNNHAEFLRKQGVENLSILNQELAAKRHQRDEIKERKFPLTKQLEEELEQALAARNELLKRMFKEWDGIRETRILGAKEMTKRLGGGVIITIADQRNLDLYYREIEEKKIKNVQHLPEQIQKVVEALHPIELVQLIREGDEKALSERAGISLSTASKFMRIEEPELMRLERVKCDDIAVIELLMEKKGKSLDELSEGEKCTAILSVILLDETSPLVIDQPEDELDHAFIMSNIVDSLSRVKQKIHPLKKDFAPRNGRQFIIATHNQNIPVLGDAEMVVKVHKVTGVSGCAAENARGLEDSETLRHILSLEGGRDAFERRHRKYNDLP